MDRNMDNMNNYYGMPPYSYDNNNFDMYDVYDISKDTTKESELLKYVGFEKDYHKSYDKDDFQM